MNGGISVGVCDGIGVDVAGTDGVVVAVAVEVSSMAAAWRAKSDVPPPMTLNAATTLLTASSTNRPTDAQNFDIVVASQRNRLWTNKPIDICLCNQEMRAAKKVRSTRCEAEIS